MLVRDELKGAIEAILFVRSEPIKVKEIAKITGASPEDILVLLTELTNDYNEKKSGMQIVTSTEGYAICTRPFYHEYVRQANQPLVAKLSQAALETLAIIAYRQPLTRPEMEAVRGVRVDRVLQSLLKRGLIQEVGHKAAPGRPMMYGTTHEFLKTFGLASLEELPQSQELSGDEQVTGGGN
ncbi:MAG: SMC-Scp complex subunit ScpB [Syntrophomonadaceae bacterium]|nr:SMC-Scp complex subunit ScpB [Syntrophomonadaceae bacterium]